MIVVMISKGGLNMSKKKAEDKQPIIKDEAVEEPKSDPKVDALSAKIAELQQQLDDSQNDYLRAQAEIQNMQKRSQKEQSALAKYGAQRLAKEVVPVMDDLKRALQVQVDNDSGQQLKTGIEMVYKHLEKALNDNDIKEIDADGVAFDPELHQAVQTVPADDDHPADTVVQVLQSGYKLADRVLRPAMVVVAQ
ncbi:Protein grpE [Fructilactobacillus sanfranciscensis TMW 1.1304]|uniref:Protein GrpE n=2 Tax=Fructilactobacillus sanfranciscensis TaxID=1625 RepID=G2KUB1_FRUST|nr:Protein grpE [Fructilactobacillus sanfranciscensis TMW 1.1304]